MWQLVLKYAGPVLEFVLSLLGGRKDDPKQVGMDAQKVADATRLNQEILDAKSEDNAAANAASGASAQWLRDNKFTRQD